MIPSIDLHATGWIKTMSGRFSGETGNNESRMGRARSAAAAAGEVMKSKYGASRVVLFGSLAKGVFDEYSDIDIAVEGVDAGLFLKAVAEVTALQGIFDVDVTDLEDCPAGIRNEILRTGVEL